MADKAFLIDTTKCIGCKACQVACKQWNNLPAEVPASFFDRELTYPKELSAITYNHVVFSVMENRDSFKSWQMMHRKCYHCGIPNCMAVCPEDAIYKDDYWVVIDSEKCIGCGECVKACVYGVPRLLGADAGEYGTGKIIAGNKAYKCNACRINVREIPACAEACPSEAITFDYRLKIVANAKRRLKEVKKEFPDASLYGLDEFGGLHVITILKDRPEKSGLEVNPHPVKKEHAETVRGIYHVLSAFTLGMPSLKRAAFKISKYLLS